MAILLVALLVTFAIVPGVIARSPSATSEATTMPTTPAPDSTAGDVMDGMPGMVVSPTPTPTMSGMGQDMNPIDPGTAPVASPNAKGGQPLTPKIVDGIKEFTLNIEKVRWSILPGIEVVAYTYNGTVPGPEIRLTVGDRVRITVNNMLPEATTIHWHGIEVPNSQDGAGDVTQTPIKSGESFTYEWTAPNTPGTFFYHSHYNSDVQQTLGLYGPLIIEPVQPGTNYDTEYTVMLGEWTVKDGKTYPAMDMEGLLPNYFTINGHSFPATDTINLKVGERVLLHFIGSGQFIHPMHLHGQSFKIVATDGYPLPEAVQITEDTLMVGPGGRYDVIFTARAPGKWLLHCHIAHHTTNDGVEVNGGGGLTMIFNIGP
ncbi:MAG: multicopper oxidase family protein [Aggregatilineales bacterium]